MDESPAMGSQAAMKTSPTTPNQKEVAEDGMAPNLEISERKSSLGKKDGSRIGGGVRQLLEQP